MLLDTAQTCPGKLEWAFLCLNMDVKPTFLKEDKLS